MRLVFALLCTAVALAPIVDAQTRKAPARKAPARAAPKRTPTPVPVVRVPAELVCPSELGVGVATARRFCDVLTGRDPKEGIRVLIPPHRGPVTLSFELHNRHTYSADLVKTKQAYRKYTATVGVLAMDHTLIARAVVQSEFRTEKDLFDRIGGGAGPGGVKAVAPTGSEPITIVLPDDIGEACSILGEKLSVVRPDGTDHFTAPGRPVATISNVMLEYTPAPAAKKR